MKKRNKITLTMLAGLLSLTMTACQDTGTAETAPVTSAEKSETTKKESVPADWKTYNVEGITMKLPEDFTDFTPIKDMYVSTDEGQTTAIIVSQKSDNPGTKAADMTEEIIQKSILGSYDNVDFVEFDNSYDFHGNEAVYLKADVDNEQGPATLVMYVILGDGSTYQLIEALLDTEKDSALADHLSAWQNSLDYTSEKNTKTEPAKSSSSSNPVADSDYGVDGDYFYVRIPEEWADDVVYRTWTNEYNGQTEYMMALHEPTSYKALEKGGTLVTFMLWPKDEDYTNLPDYDLLGTMDINGVTYNVIALYPTDAGFTEATKEAYKQWKEQVPNVVETFTAKDGYTFTPAD